MSNKRTLFLFIIFLLCGMSMAWAQEIIPAQPVAAAPSTISPLPSAGTAEGPLTVTDILIDKTDKNAVIARDAAIVEARRRAFQSLAEKSMTPEAFKSYPMPDDAIISTLVQDFEIKNEQISANRYVANFTVRFSPAVSNYITIPTGTTSIVANPQPVASPSPPVPSPAPAAEVPSGPRAVLVLPYFEDISGKKKLWEDPNPWREAWQATGSSAPMAGLTITVPLGDIADISSGNTDAVWSGEYAVLEKLRENYSASEVILAVANKSGVQMRVDIYLYKDGKLERKKPVTPYMTARTEGNPFLDTIPQVVREIQSLEDFTPVENPVTQDSPWPPPTELIVDDVKPAEPAVPVPPPPPEKVDIEATINFATFPQWLEVQRRLTSISPTLIVEISSLSKNSARFTVHYEDGMEAFKKALAERGLALNALIAPVDPTVTDEKKEPPKAVYEIQMLN